MSEFPEWVERELDEEFGFFGPDYEEARIIHEAVKDGLWPDPRGTGVNTFAAFWRQFPWWDRRTPKQWKIGN